MQRFFFLRGENDEVIPLLTQSGASLQEHEPKRRPKKSLCCCAFATTCFWFLVLILIAGAATLYGYVYIDEHCKNAETQTYNYTASTNKLVLYAGSQDLVELIASDMLNELLISVEIQKPAVLVEDYLPIFRPSKMETIFIDVAPKTLLGVRYCGSSRMTIYVPSTQLVEVAIFTDSDINLTGASGLQSVTVQSTNSTSNWNTVHLFSFSARSVNIAVPSGSINGDLVSSGNGTNDSFAISAMSINMHVSNFVGSFEVSSDSQQNVTNTASYGYLMFTKNEPNSMIGELISFDSIVQNSSLIASGSSVYITFQDAKM